MPQTIEALFKRLPRHPDGRPDQEKNGFLFLFYGSIILYFLLILIIIPAYENKGFCGNCRIMSVRDFWYRSILIPGFLSSILILRLSRRQAGFAPILPLAIYLALLLDLVSSRLILGRFIVHGSGYDIFAAWAGHLWWIALFISGLCQRAFFFIPLPENFQFRFPRFIRSYLYVLIVITGLGNLGDSILLDIGFMPRLNISGLKDIHEAAETGDLPRVKKLLTDDPSLLDLQRKERGQATPLYYAALFGHDETALFLISRGAKVDARTSESRKTPLMAAAGNAGPGVVQALIAAGDDVNAAPEYWRGPLGSACEKGRVANARLLLEAGADLSYRDRWGKTALHVAAGNERMVGLLLQFGADVTATDEDGRTPMYYASVESADLLMMAGTEPGPMKIGEPGKQKRKTP